MKRRVEDTDANTDANTDVDISLSKFDCFTKELTKLFDEDNKKLAVLFTNKDTFEPQVFDDLHNVLKERVDYVSKLNTEIKHFAVLDEKLKKHGHVLSLDNGASTDLSKEQAVDIRQQEVSSETVRERVVSFSQHGALTKDPRDLRKPRTTEKDDSVPIKKESKHLTPEQLARLPNKKRLVTTSSKPAEHEIDTRYDRPCAFLYACPVAHSLKELNKTHRSILQHRKYGYRIYKAGDTVYIGCSNNTCKYLHYVNKEKYVPEMNQNLWSTDEVTEMHKMATKKGYVVTAHIR